MPTVAATVGLVATLASIGLGWRLGFRALPAFLAFWTMGACVLCAAVRLDRRCFAADGSAGALLRAGTMSFAIIVAAELLLGILGLVGLAPQILVCGAIAGASLTLRPPPTGRAPAVSRPALLLIAALVPLLILIVGSGINQSPLTLYDSLSYHLVFPARWLLDHRLSIVPTPFGDEAQAYAPANGELFFLWLMTPFHGDLCARLGQLPFYLLGAVALYALARQAGASSSHAVYPPLFYFFSRPIVEQALGADVDLICWAMFLSSIYLANIAAARDDRRDWLLWGVSVGLYCGTKYVALVYLPIALAFALQRGVRRRMVWALPGLLLFAAPWYLRNWIIAGSPIYPASLTLGGLTLARGAYTRQAMQHSVFHTTNVRLFPALVAHAMGVDLLMMWIPAALIGGWTMLAGRQRRAAWLVATPVAMCLLYWAGVPDNVDSRFLLPAAMLALLPFAFLFRANRWWNAGVRLALVAGVVWLVVGRSSALTVTLPWYMAAWLSLGGIVARGVWPWWVAMELLALAVAYALASAPGRAVVALTLVGAAGMLTFAYGSEHWCVPDRCQFLTPTSIYLRSDLIYGWRWANDHIADGTIANTGNNVPYPLFGEHLTNRVYYVNIDRHRDWRFHDYERAHRHHQAGDPEPAQPLAIPSGVLMPIDPSRLSQIDAVRPRYERWIGLRDAWIDNLKSRGVNWLFVTVLSPYELDDNWHDSRGFPIEAEWARADAVAFTPVFSNSRVRIFAVHPP